MKKLLSIAFAGCLAVSAAGAFAQDKKDAMANDKMKKECEAKAGVKDSAKMDSTQKAAVTACMDKGAQAPAKDAKK